MAHRIFVGMPLAGAAAQGLAERLEHYRATLAPPDIRWIPRANWHLTLRFLGSVPAERVDDIIAVVREAVTPRGAIRCRAQRIGGFPRRRPAVVACVLSQAGALLELAASVRSRLQDYGFGDDDKPFRPHVTVGRFRGRGRSPLPEAQMDIEMALGEVVTYRSETLPDGARYTPLQTLYLEAGIDDVD